MYGYYDNPDRPFRWVQCPDCGAVGFSSKKTYQCKGPLRHRVDTDDNIFKTPEDRYLERQKLDKELSNEYLSLKKEREEFLQSQEQIKSDYNKKYDERTSRIFKMKQSLKPLYSPNIPKPEKPKETTTALVLVNNTAITQIRSIQNCI